MKLPAFIESARNSETFEVAFRFVCSACSPRVEGAWHPSLEDAERSKDRHVRMKHGEVVRA